VAVVAVAVATFVLLRRTPAPAPPPVGAPAHAFVVTSYGAVGDGTTDSSHGIQAAIAAAQAAGGGEVYLPAGHFLDASGLQIQVPPGPAVVISGAGRDQTDLIQGRGGKALLSVKADGSTVENLSLDTHTNNAGAAFETTANNVTLQHCRATGSTTIWAVRFAGGGGTARPTAPTYATGNTVRDLILHDYAPGPDDGLDFSYQSHGTIDTVTHIGSRVGLFIDSQVTVTNYSFSPEPSLSSGTYGYFITAPSDHITITNFTSSGQGGHIGAAPVGTTRQSHDITISGERMTGPPTDTFFIGDVTAAVVENSVLGTVHIAPRIAAQVVFRGTTDAALVRQGAPGAVVQVTTA
jgi:hypothetical protein